MEKTITTDLPLSNLTSGYVDYGENIDQTCFVSLELKAIAAVCMAISLCGLLGNGLVVCFLDFHVRHSSFSNYIANLAVVDFTLLLLFLLLMVSVLSFSTFCSNDLVSLYLNFVLSAAVTCQFFDLSSLGFLTAMSVQQCLDVLLPTWYDRRWQSRQCSGIKFLGLLVLAGLFFFPRYLSSTVARSYETAFAGVAIAVCTILASLMLVSSLALFIKLRCGSDRRHPRKAHVAVLLSVIFFLALGIPFTVEIFLYLPHSYELFPEIASLTSFLLGSLNSSIKPLLYFLLGSCQQHRIQGSLRVALRRVFEEEATREERSQEPGDAVMDSVL